MGSHRNIVVEGMKASRPLTRAVGKQVEKWIHREQTLMLWSKDTDFQVRVGNQSSVSRVDCDIHVRMGQREWLAHEEGRTVSEAVERALHHMHRQNGR